MPQRLMSPPAVAWAGALAGANAATTLPGGVIYPVSDARISVPLRHLYDTSLPGNPTVGGLPCHSVRRQFSRNGVAKANGSLSILRFKTDAPVIEISGVVVDGTWAVVTLIVDGELVPPKALASFRVGAGWNVGTIRIAFDSRRMRDIWIEMGFAAAYIKLDQGDTFTAPDDEGAPQITVVGDSYLSVRSDNFGNSGGIALELAGRLGVRKVAIDGVGGTGYTNSGGNIGNLNDRLPGHAGDGSSIYVIMAGLNDYGDLDGSGPVDWQSRAIYEQAVLGYLQGLRAAQPDAVIVVTAPFCPVAPMSDSSYVAHPATNSSGLGDFLYKANVHKQAIAQVSAPWVYIDVLMGGGWLTSSGASGDITNLQWFTGGTPGPGTTATNKPGNTNGGGGGGFGGIANVPVIAGGSYSQAPDILAIGGTGTGLLASSRIDSNGRLTSIPLIAVGHGYTPGSGLPTFAIDPTFEISPATLGTAQLMTGTNPDGQYPLASFAPPGTSPADLNNIYFLLHDKVHPSQLGAEYLARRLARNIYAAVMML